MRPGVKYQALTSTGDGSGPRSGCGFGRDVPGQVRVERFALVPPSVTPDGRGPRRNASKKMINGGLATRMISGSWQGPLGASPLSTVVLHGGIPTRPPVPLARLDDEQSHRHLECGDGQRRLRADAREQEER